jgi:hypothetical protein
MRTIPICSSSNVGGEIVVESAGYGYEVGFVGEV